MKVYYHRLKTDEEEVDEEEIELHTLQIGIPEDLKEEGREEEKKEERKKEKRRKRKEEKEKRVEERRKRKEGRKEEKKRLYRQAVQALFEGNREALFSASRSVVRKGFDFRLCRFALEIWCHHNSDPISSVQREISSFCCKGSSPLYQIDPMFIPRMFETVFHCLRHVASSFGVFPRPPPWFQEQLDSWEKHRSL